VDPKQFQDILAQTMRKDRFRLSKRFSELNQQARRRQGQGSLLENNAAWQALLTQAMASVADVEKRKIAVPHAVFDNALPICERREEIAEALRKHQVIIVAGETGSGKTTQLPKICLEEGRGIYGLIGHTQPRRLAARSVADRIAAELQSKLGDWVGYKVRFNEQMNPSAYIKLMTDGILLAEIQHDRLLEQYDTLIIDEAHERSLNIDFLLGYLKGILPKRPDLKIIITSATIDHHRFAAHFDLAPVIEVVGRTYPVTTLYRPPVDEADDDGEVSTAHSVVCAVEELIDLDRLRNKSQPGGILIFCSGEQEIRELAAYLRRIDLPHTEILPLYARLSQKDQQKIFSPGRGRRIVIATNVAETSLTVPAIRYVIDLGKARISRYSYRSKVQRLPIEAISQASANQRQGRCGRVAEGLCIRLYSEEDFLSQKAFTDPEILRTNLASVILQMEHLRLGSIEQFPFIDKPDSRFVRDGYGLLYELGAMDEKKNLTSLGRTLAALPVDPRIGRMVIEATQQASLKEVLIVASALTVQDPRERPYEFRQRADEAHKKFQDERSDFLSLITLWQSYEEQRQLLSQNQLKQYCRENFLSHARMKEWRDIHHQLRVTCKQLGFEENQHDADYASIHKAILAGLLSQMGCKTSEGDYQGARNSRFVMAPGSPLARKKPQWIMAAELLETNRLYARQVALIEPQWAEALAPDLVTHRYSDPVWRKRRGEVVARQTTTLYGLILQAERFVSYSSIDPDLCRELFLTEGLVKGDMQTDGAFLAANQTLIAELERFEHKTRRRDILVDEQAVYDFYNKRIPNEICSRAPFEKWRKSAEKTQPRLLFLTRDDLLKRETDDISITQFPDVLTWNGMSFPLHYHFEPGHAQDGVTLRVPLVLLHTLPTRRLEWLVPGMLRDKCIALFKALPKQWRKNFVPIPDYVDACLSTLSAGDIALTQKINEYVKKKSRITIPDEEWRAVVLEPQHLFNIEVVNDEGAVLDQGRDIIALRERCIPGVLPQLGSSKDALEKAFFTEWTFGDLQDYIDETHAGMTLRRYPALIDQQQKGVSLVLLNNASEARQLTRKGLIRLLVLKHSQGVRQLRKDLSQNKTLLMNFRNLGNEKELMDMFIDAALMRCFKLYDREIKTQAEFEQSYAATSAHVSQQTQSLVSLLEKIGTQYQHITKKLQVNTSLSWATSLLDIKEQMKHLFSRDFLLDVPDEHLKDYPRYLEAILKRLEKLQENLHRDHLAMLEFKPFWAQFEQRQQHHQREHIVDPALQNYRWLLEEYRVSLFAQELKTKVPVSPKRLRLAWESVQL